MDRKKLGKTYLQRLENAAYRGEPVRSVMLSKRVVGVQLRQIPDFVREFRGLRHLDLAEQPIKELPAWLAELEELETLDLSHVTIKSLRSEILTLPSLRRLDVTRIRGFLGDELANATQLRELRVHGDPPEAIGELEQLESLWVDGPAALPASIGALTGLRELRVFGNEYVSLAAFPAGILGMSELRTLVFQDQRVPDLPGGLEDLDKLEALDLSGSVAHVAEWPDFSKLSALKTIVLSGRSFSKFPLPQQPAIDAVLRAPNLEHVSLREWWTTDEADAPRHRPAPLNLPDVFDRLPNLRTIDLTGSRFDALPTSFFGLERLDWAKLEPLDAASFASLSEAMPDTFVSAAGYREPPLDDETYPEASALLEERRLQQSEESYRECIDQFKNGIAASDRHFAAVYRPLLAAVTGAVESKRKRKADDFASLGALADEVLEHFAHANITHIGPGDSQILSVLESAAIARAFAALGCGEGLDEALDIIERFAGKPTNLRDQLREYRARLLLELGRATEAYEIVYRAIRDDESARFPNIRMSEEYQVWLGASDRVPDWWASGES